MVVLCHHFQQRKQRRWKHRSRYIAPAVWECAVGRIPAVRPNVTAVIETAVAQVEMSAGASGKYTVTLRLKSIF